MNAQTDRDINYLCTKEDNLQVYPHLGVLLAPDETYGLYGVVLLCGVVPVVSYLLGNHCDLVLLERSGGFSSFSPSLLAPWPLPVG